MRYCTFVQLAWAVTDSTYKTWIVWNFRQIISRHVIDRALFPSPKDCEAHEDTNNMVIA